MLSTWQTIQLKMLLAGGIMCQLKTRSSARYSGNVQSGSNGLLQGS